MGFRRGDVKSTELSCWGGKKLESQMDDLTNYYQAFKKVVTGDICFAILVALISRIYVLGTSWLFNYNFELGRSLENLLCSWDCGWYLSIIVNGYHLQPQGHLSGDAANWAFFPLFPLSAKAISYLTGLSALNAAALISNACFILALPILFSYVKRMLGTQSARFVIIAFAFSPYSLYFSTPYTESLYFLLMVSSLSLAKSNNWLTAGILAAMISATRNLGVLLVIPLLIIAIRQYRIKDLMKFSDGSEKVIFCLLIAPLGLFVYMYYLHQHVGDALAFKNVQIAWGRAIGNPLIILIRSFFGRAYEIYCATVACVSFMAGLYLFQKRFVVEGVIFMIGIIVPLATGIAAIPRYVFTLFPIYIVLALLTRGCPRLRYLLLCCLIQLSGFTIMSWMASKEYMQ
jgi:hypothetical protein